ncbi:hypothetical protein LPJ66_003426 [Kickxella alabastrina]|uniref:Uncharacterized protein n=1 Tax=Kickxella alabastrina TaxID=61397 RepID=A0ACC1IM84_9FUNG|nr:hypothetical protein LPJ66_003426 [Kickxella alabastrina]
MAATLKRGMGKLGLKTNELLGLDSSTKGDSNDEFRDLQQEIDSRQVGTENIQAALILYTNHLLKKKDSSDNSKQKLFLLENLGSSMFRLGASLPSESKYGQVIEQFGQVEERLNDLKIQFINSTKDGWVSSLQRSIDEFKEYQSLQKKLDVRRSDFESKQSKLQKSRKENITLEDDVRTAQVRYDDTYEDVTRRMLDIKDSDHDHLVELYSFYEAQAAYHRSCSEQLERLRSVFEENLKAKRLVADRSAMSNSLSSRRSAMTLKSNDGSVSGRIPIPFGNQSLQQSNSHQSLPRTASARGALSHHRNGSTQFSDTSDELGSHRAMSPFESSGSHDSAARQPPQFARVQSDISPMMRKAAPTVAPRRHAPPPPTPARPAARVLRRAIYKFNANEVGELAMEKGDVVEVTEHIDDGWWYGKIVHSASGQGVITGGGQPGLFPTNYTEDCSESDIPPPLLSRAPTAHRSQTTPNELRMPVARTHHRTGSNVPAMPAPMTNESVCVCACGCDDFEKNPFKPSLKECRNCYHIH